MRATVIRAVRPEHFGHPLRFTLEKETGAAVGERGASHTPLPYRCEGRGEPLLLIHGWGVTYSIWRNLAPLLRAHFRLIMIELPGIGGAPHPDPEQLYYPACADAIEAVRRALGIERWALLAYSSGTRAAEAYLQRYPQRVSRAAFLCPVYLSRWCSFGLRLLTSTHPRPRVIKWALSDWRLYGLVLVLGFNGRRTLYTGEWQREIERQPVMTLLRSLTELPGQGRTPFPALAIPTLFIWGRRDALIAHPRRLQLNDRVIAASHSAPLLAAPRIAHVVIPFFSGEQLQPSMGRPQVADGPSTA